MNLNYENPHALEAVLWRSYHNEKLVHRYSPLAVLGKPVCYEKTQHSHTHTHTQINS